MVQLLSARLCKQPILYAGVWRLVDCNAIDGWGRPLADAHLLRHRQQHCQPRTPRNVDAVPGTSAWEHQEDVHQVHALQAATTGDKRMHACLPCVSPMHGLDHEQAVCRIINDQQATSEADLYSLLQMMLTRAGVSSQLWSRHPLREVRRLAGVSTPHPPGELHCQGAEAGLWWS